MNSIYFTEEHNLFRKSLQHFLKKEVVPHIDTWEKTGEIDRFIWKEFGEMGFFGMNYPEAYGGMDLDLFYTIILLEELQKINSGGFAAAIWAHVYLAMTHLNAEGNDDIKERYLAPSISGEKVGCLCVTEPFGGSDVAGMRTTAVKDGDNYIINGSKTFITGGMEADYFVIGARTGGPGVTGISLFFVEADAPGFSRTPLKKKMGWWASNQATLYFEDCRVPATNLMGQEDYGFLAIMHNFNNERLTLIAGRPGMMKAALEDSIEWAQQRETFGKPLIKHQVIRHKIADMSAKIDAVESYMNMICWNMEQGEAPVAELSKGKFFATKALEFVASEAMQILGGAGYLRGNRVESIYRDVKVMAIGGGSEEIMRDLAVRQMGL